MAGSIAAMFHAPTRPVFSSVGAHLGVRHMATEEPGQVPESPEDARLTSLNQRLKQAQLEETARKGKPDSERSRQVVRSAGMRILSDLVGLPFGGGLIGSCDRLVHLAASGALRVWPAFADPTLLCLRGLRPPPGAGSKFRPLHPRFRGPDPETASRPTEKRSASQVRGMSPRVGSTTSRSAGPCRAPWTRRSR